MIKLRKFGLLVITIIAVVSMLIGVFIGLNIGLATIPSWCI